MSADSGPKSKKEFVFSDLPPRLRVSRCICFEWQRANGVLGGRGLCGEDFHAIAAGMFGGVGRHVGGFD
jgi:hypothetical protein